MEKDIEKYSSAITLSDMEIFIFPELLYSLLLANIMSPVLWQWENHPWFKDIKTMTPYRRVLRLKQYIMDNYSFNLDLETWGLTAKEQEIARFKVFMDEDTISQSNALFGYEGEKYYFDIDIRRHFGLDKYASSIIPYWKTETIEAMDAFRYKPGHNKGAGECVSLSALYAAALFVICKIPLEKIYLMATPLHSQNYIDIGDGLLTNNRRIVTRNMWFNGTEITAKSQRALKNEQVTIVAHNTGYVHVVYAQATISAEAYKEFSRKLSSFLVTDIDSEIFCNFLRQESQLQTCFQLKDKGVSRYIEAEIAFAYEQTSTFRVNESTRDKLLAEIDNDEFSSSPLADRIILDCLNEYFEKHTVNEDPESLEAFMNQLGCPDRNRDQMIRSLQDFCRTTPRLPGEGKLFRETPAISLTTEMDRDQIIGYLESIRETNHTADLSFYAYRDLSRTDWAPFYKAAVERNPVSILGAEKLSGQEVIEVLAAMSNDSIYDGSRLAQPDEVWNYRRGDGLEKAICLLNIFKSRGRQVSIHTEEGYVVIAVQGEVLRWPSGKGLSISQACPGSL